jgi:hypothetical protein
MHGMVIIGAGENPEAGLMPRQELLAEMGRLPEAPANVGVLRPRP